MTHRYSRSYNHSRVVYGLNFLKVRSDVEPEDNKDEGKKGRKEEKHDCASALEIIFRVLEQLVLLQLHPNVNPTSPETLSFRSLSICSF